MRYPINDTLAAIVVVVPFITLLTVMVWASKVCGH